MEPPSPPSFPPKESLINRCKPIWRSFLIFNLALGVFVIRGEAGWMSRWCCQYQWQFFLSFFCYWHRVSENCIPTNPGSTQALDKEFSASAPQLTCLQGQERKMQSLLIANLLKKSSMITKLRKKIPPNLLRVQLPQLLRCHISLIQYWSH
ncbi:uncharacterized protein LOC121250904 isoform X1 [Juglans microcarpa x Juglans regia]|uniref:uncharacterized protein LOC121250904 isoform X1 n=1 Tax=Juglans microcarpa x Juglans regia TaxID=2249226 RepID=UPI001B7E969B|nr:uncharacterized protein LOC121250904 isoform X1 [Juglans microcarpa x Juglans regia]